MTAAAARSTLLVAAIAEAAWLGFLAWLAWRG